MCFNHLSCQGKAQPGALLLGGVERSEHMGLNICGYSRSVIGDANLVQVVVDTDLDVDGGVGRRGLPGVANEIDDDLLDAITVGLEEDVIGALHPQGDLRALQVRAHEVSDVDEEGVGGKDRHLELGLAREI